MNTVDDELHGAAANLRRELELVTPPPFRPRPQVGGRLVLVAATVAVFALGVVAFRNGLGGDGELGPAGEPDVAAETDLDDTANSNSTADGDPEQEADALDVRPTPGPAVTDSRHRPTTDMDRPTVDGFALEPEFGSIIASVSQAPAGGTVTPIQDGAPSWNADGSLIVLYESGELAPRHVLYDGTTFARLGALPITPRDIEEVFWSPEQPTRIYFTEENRLQAFEVDTTSFSGSLGGSFNGDEVAGAESTVHEFAGCREVGAPLTANPISARGALMGLLCFGENEREWVSLDLNSKEEHRTPAATETTPHPTPSGAAFVIQSDRGEFQVVDRTLASPSVSLTTDPNPPTLALVETGDGRELLVTTVFELGGDRNGSVIAYDLATGEATSIVGPATGFPYPPAGHRFSASLTSNGLLAVSIAGQPEPGDQDTLDGELLLVDFNPASPVAYRLGHHRSPSNGVFDPYWAFAQLSIHPDGSRMLFSSSWDQDRIDTFVIDTSSLIN